MRKAILILAATSLSFVLPARGQTAVEGRGVWAHPGDFGKSLKDVEAFFQVLKKANVQIVVPMVKGIDGRGLAESAKK